MKKKGIFHSIVLAAVFFLAVSLRVSAQDETPPPSDDDVNRIAREMYCPVCENIPLDVCETTACVQWRELIREKLAAGWTDDQIKDYFVLQYGDRVLAIPPGRGLNRLIYIVPGVIFLGGVYILIRVFRGLRKKPAENLPETVGGEGHEPYEHRIEEALKEKRK